jgi:hypothetical protein
VGSGESIDFNGTSQYVNVPDTVHPTATITAWVNGLNVGLNEIEVFGTALVGGISDSSLSLKKDFEKKDGMGRTGENYDPSVFCGRTR